MDSPNMQEHNVKAFGPVAITKQLLRIRLELRNREAITLITKQNQEISPFLRLPPELRNIIYAYVFDSATMTCHPKYLLDRIDFDNSHLHRVCRQIRAEIHSYRKEHTYSQVEAMSPLSFVDWAGYAQRTKIVQIQMSFSVAKLLRLHIEEDLGGSQPCKDGVKLFPSLQCIVVTGRSQNPADEIDILTFLQDALDEIDILAFLQGISENDALAV